jgi:hypothetical protein
MHQIHGLDRHTRHAVVVGAVALLAGVVSLGWASDVAAHAGNNDPLVMHACTKPQGQVRIVAVAEACLPSEQAVHWGGEDQVVALQQAVATLQASVAALQSALMASQATLACLHMEGATDLVVEGCNVHVRSGGGATDAAVNGLGNLIVGYNEGTGFQRRTGSHNLIVGPLHTYSSFGGFVAGQANNITGQFASVSGGQSSTASGTLSSVSGGRANSASGDLASVSGGDFNTASGFLSSVSGGDRNRADGIWSSVSGGVSNTASGQESSVSGGLGRSALGDMDWAAGSLFEDF